MALELQGTIEETTLCTNIEFFDPTGTYNASTNPGGYGSPNLASSAVTKAILNVYKYGDTVPVIFTFTVSSNVITAATVTRSGETAVSILADLASTAFPIVEASPLAIIGEYLTGEEDSDIESDTYYFEYSVTDGTTTYLYTVDQLLVCTTCCCVGSMQRELNAADCKCDKDKIMKAFTAQVYLDAAIWSMEKEEIEKAHNNIAYAKELCAGGCQDC